MSTAVDLAIVGAGFAGLACAHSAARRGLSVLVLDRKAAPGHRMHTTGLLVKEVAEKLNVPAHLTRTISGVRLYAPNLRFVDLDAPGYYFLATDIQGLMSWLAQRATASGATLCFGTPYRGIHDIRSADEGRLLALRDMDASARFLLGADGPSSAVAREFRLSANREFLIGVEAEYEGISNVDENRLHCFLDAELAPGYIGWVIPGVNITQVGLACRVPGKPRLRDFVQKISALFDFSKARLLTHRGGLIPVGGRVDNWSTERVLLAGDAAGIVSPLTAGGIHTALESGWRAGHAIADFLRNGGPHPGVALAPHYPPFRLKRLMRRCFDLNPPNALYNLLLGSAPFRSFAAEVYFHRRAMKSRQSGKPDN
ncbi:MAG: NAD(P)/FAD-dependent oxidoreductase [Burkholderiales bacterium]